MTAQQWHSSTSAWCMMCYLRWDLGWSRWWHGLRPTQLLGARKRLLLAVACVRDHWHLLEEGGREQRWVDLSEAYADHLDQRWRRRNIPESLPQPRNDDIGAAYGARSAAFCCVRADEGLEVLSK